MMREMWFPIDGSDKVIGRFRDTEISVTQADKTKKVFIRPALEARIAGNSTEVSFQVVKDFNKEELIARCPAGWAYYEQHIKDKPDNPDAPMVADHGIKGTPIEKMGSFNNERIVWFKSQGLHTVEQLAGISDGNLGNLGMGARGWRKKAAEFLASEKAA